MSVFTVLGNQHYLIRNNTISIKTLAFLVRVIVMKTSPAHRKRSSSKTRYTFVTVMGCNALKEAVPLERNKALHCSYLHAHILHPRYFAHDRLCRLRGEHIHWPALSHATVSSTQIGLCETKDILTNIPNTGLLAASDEWYKYARELGLIYKLFKFG